MKKLSLVTGLLLAAAVASQAQGVINFSSAGAGVNAKFQTAAEAPGGTTLLRSINNTFVADFFFAPGSTTVGVNSESLVNIGGFNQGFTTSTTAAQYGFFSGGAKTLNSVAGGTALVGQVRVWDNTFGTFAQARAAAGAQWFESPMFVITPTVSPSPVPNLVGLGNGVTYTLNYNAVVPEPSSMALAGLGAASLLIFRRRK